MGFGERPVGLIEKENTPLLAADAAENGVVEGAEILLRNNSYLALKNVSCEYHEGVLTLRGCLPSYYLKQMAQSTVACVEGVQRIVNDIQVVSAPR